MNRRSEIVVAVAGPKDTFPVSDATLVVPYDTPGHPNRVEDRTRDIFAANGLAPSPLALDLLRVASTAYVADMRLARDTGYDGWTREIALRVFVSDAERWREKTDLVERMLAFLTGDHWTVDFRSTHAEYVPTAAKKPKAVHQLSVPTVALLSGGLDSFIGAIDGVEQGEIAFVAHHGGGGGATSASQDHVRDVLTSAYGEDRVRLLQFWFAPPAVSTGVTETSTRSRSLLFVALGVVVAFAAGAERLVIPENGVISLNLPLTPARLGSFSTRTTHPHYIALFRQLLQHLDLTPELTLPYRFATKGEMLVGAKNQDVLAKGLSVTMSCSHPDSNRFRAKNPHLHCGRCVPCVIRRAATTAWGTDPTAYAQDDLSGPIGGQSGADLRALRIALHRYTRRPPTVRDILSAGPLPVPDDDIARYVEVYRRGVDELREFLKAHPESATP